MPENIQQLTGNQSSQAPAQQQVAQTVPDPMDITFALDEDTGQMIIIPKAAPSSEVPQEDVRFQSAVESTQTQRIPEANPLDDRMNKLENAVTQLGTFLQGMAQGNLSNLNQQPTQQPQDEIDLSNGIDGATLVKIINTAVDKALSTRMAPIQENQSLILMRQEYNDAAYRYGQDFITLTPAMVELKKSDPNIPWDVAFKAIQMGAQAYQGKKSTASDSTIQTGNGSVQNGKPQPAQTLVQRAQQLSTENGGQPRTIVDTQGKQNRTLNEAFDKALIDLGLA